VLAEGETTHIVIGKDMKIVPMPQKYVDAFRDAAGKQ
jgi:acyl-CoA thioesterase FadM